MKKSSVFILGIPLIVAGVIVAVVFYMKFVTSMPQESVPLSTSGPIPTLKLQAGKPQSGFADTTNTGAVSSIDLVTEWESTAVSDDADEFSNLNTDASAL